MNSRTPGSRDRRSSRSSSSRVQDNLSREERKEATRRAIITAALKLLEEDSFGALSLREVTREAGIVPAAFYRHFETMDALGLVLIDESFRALREMLRGGRAGQLDPKRIKRGHSQSRKRRRTRRQARGRRKTVRGCNLNAIIAPAEASDEIHETPHALKGSTFDRHTIENEPVRRGVDPRHLCSRPEGFERERQTPGLGKIQTRVALAPVFDERDIRRGLSRRHIRDRYYRRAQRRASEANRQNRRPTT